MTKLWPVKVFRKFQNSKQFKFRNSNPNRGQGGKIPAQVKSTGVSTAKSTPPPHVDCQVDTGVDLAQKPILGLVGLVHLVANLGLFYWPVTDFDGSNLS